VTPPNSSAAASSLHAEPVRSCHVLIVDDEPVIRRVAELALTGEGHTVVEAGDTASAVRTICETSRPFDLILLDRTLPDGEGTALIPAIRREAPAARILVVSGLGQLDAASLGADGFLAKPFTRTSLLAAVQRALTSGTPAAPDP
jgi:two-component system, OmpR family, response regulator